MTVTSTLNPSLQKDIVDNAYSALQGIEAERTNIMTELQTAAQPGSTKEVALNSATIDISTGAGALVLDNYMQELSTVEQAAAQIVAQSNKAQKTVHSQTGQV